MAATLPPRVAADLEEQLPLAEADLRAFAGARLLITGGTGFIGRWLLASLVHANARAGLGIEAIVVARDPERLRALDPALAADPALRLVAGDVRALPEVGPFDACVHAATPASAALNRDAPLEMLETIVAGGAATLARAAAMGEIPVLLTSTGAVYGPQGDLARRPETAACGPDPLAPGNAYAEGKRVAELQGAIYARDRGLRVKVARLFAFVGPYLPLDRHFAAGNFVGDALAGRPIRLTGDGSTVRSYQYAAETTTWLWAILARGRTLRAYNVGSEEAVTTGELAARVAAAAGGPPPTLGAATPGAPVDRYVPETTRAREELGLRHAIGLDEALRRTLAFHRDA